jgi:hypothetical protein
VAADTGVLTSGWRAGAALEMRGGPEPYAPLSAPSSSDTSSPTPLVRCSGTLDTRFIRRFRMSETLSIAVVVSGQPLAQCTDKRQTGIGSRGHARCVGGVVCRNAELWPCKTKKKSAMRGLDKHAHTGHRCARYKSWSPRELLTSRCSFKWPTPCSCHGRGVRVANTAVVSRHAATTLKLWLKLESAELDPNSFETF